MVGSVLMSRMMEEGDFKGFEPVFFSTSNPGGVGPDIGQRVKPLKDAFDLEELKDMDIIVTCQGSDYTKKVYPELRKAGWNGYFIDSSSALRMEPDSVIVLDPVNRNLIDESIEKGIKTYVGGNCTVSLMLMALWGLIKTGNVEWITSMTYQAASGAGAKHMVELIRQMAFLIEGSQEMLSRPDVGAIELDKALISTLRGGKIPCENFKVPLALNLIPWIDSPMANGQTREEWKGNAEANKILQMDPPLAVDGICVRVGAMRCHSQALTIKLKKEMPLDEIEEHIANAHEWVKLVPNVQDLTLKELTPVKISGSLTVAIGRLRKMIIGEKFLAAFTVGDQLLWGAAEPIRRILRIVLGFRNV
ncbi:MAG: aspartate-semialdehyde dehydrogenase [Desulfatiglandales bacterium]